MSIPKGVRTCRRGSVCAEPFNPDIDDEKTEKHIVIPKSEKAYRRILASTKNNLLFKNLSAEQKQEVFDAMFEKKCTKGEVIIREGDEGDNFYVIDSGIFDVFLKKPNVPSYGCKVLTIGEGGSFGELALMYNSPRSATVVARSNSSILWAVDRISFRRIIVEKTARQRRLYEKFLLDVPILKSLTHHERCKFADCLEPLTIDKNSIIIMEGDTQPEYFFLIEEGTAAAFKGDKEVMKYGRGDYFGEIALLSGKSRMATVRATSKCKLVAMDKKAFIRLMGPCEDILRRNMDNYVLFDPSV